MTIRAQWFFATCILLVLTTAVACGRKTPPLVPDSPRPAMIKDIKVTTRDTIAFVSWPLPDRNVEGRDISAADIRQFNVYRAVIKRDRKKVKYKIYAEIDMANPAPAELRNNRVFWNDENLTYGQVYGYRVRAISVRGGTSPQSDEVRIVPLMSLAIPRGLAAQGNDSSIQLFWTPITTRIDGSPYEGFVGYNIYRRSVANGPEEPPLNKEPLTQTSFEDIAVSNDRTYFYFVRSMNSPTPPWKESLDSEEVSATPRDMTPPNKPVGLTVVPGVGRAFLTWNENTERDIAGYNVYRSTRGGKNYQKLTDKPLTLTTFSDESAKQGASYYYAVSAVDQAGNEGARSGKKKTRIEKLR
jgi:fibronectin type 3 domain-containing protein